MKKRNNTNAPVIVVVAIAIVALIVIVTYFVIKKVANNNGGREVETSTNSELDAHLNGGWIDCMPPLDDFETRLCERAEEINYPYIAY
jgi:hypothetical protein